MRPKQKLFIITHKKIIIYFKLYYMVLIAEENLKKYDLSKFTFETIE